MTPVDVKELVLDDILSADPYWDGTSGGGLRCSSVGEDAARYHDPSLAYMEKNGRSLASMMPAGHGVRGVIIPRASVGRSGGSRGFDPHKPRLVNIDPDIKGQSSVIDIAKLGQDVVEEAYRRAAEIPGMADDPRLLASQAFRFLAVSTDPVGMGPASRPGRELRQAPLPGAYVVPASGPNGRQLLEQQEAQMQEEVLSSPSVSPTVQPVSQFRAVRVPQQMVEAYQVGQQLQPVTPMQPVMAAPMPQTAKAVPMDTTKQRVAATRLQAAPSPTGSLMQRVASAPSRQTLPVPNQLVGGQMQVGPPRKKIFFECRGWGQMPFVYHDIVKQDNLLVLVYDNRYTEGSKLYPPAKTPTETDPDAGILAAQLDGDNTIYTVHSTGTKFTHANYEYYILVVAEEFLDSGAETDG
jgi:hypothetical protein